MTVYCCQMMLSAYRQVSRNKTMSLPQLVQTVFKLSTVPLHRRLARPARYFVNFLLIVVQLSYCSVYILFSSRLIKEVVDSRYPNSGYTIRFYETAVTAFLIPYCFIKTLSVLSFFSSFANFIHIGCLVVVMQVRIFKLNNLVCFYYSFSFSF